VNGVSAWSWRKWIFGSLDGNGSGYGIRDWSIIVTDNLEIA
jgi:hypothetical protein